MEPALSDERIAEQVVGGDRDAFEVIMRRHNQRLFRTARAILKDDAEAEDAVQQGYLSAYRSLDSFRGEARLATWLTRIVVHEALRRRKRGRFADLSVVEEPEEERVPSPEEHASQGELRILLERAIDSLPDSYRVVFVMRDVQEMTSREVGACLDMTEEAVRVRLHRARRALREWLMEQMDTKASDAFRFAGTRCDRIVAYVLRELPGAL